MERNIALVLIAFVLFIASPVVTKSQNALLTAGSDISGTGGNVSYSMGQVSYSVIEGLNFNLIEGVQQPYEISVITQTDDFRESTFAYSVYPNPSTNILYLKHDNNLNQDMHYQMFNIEGEVIKNSIIENPITSIPVFDLASSTYFLKIYVQKTSVKTFKIIKH